jgi:hypothetical protein
MNSNETFETVANPQEEVNEYPELDAETIEAIKKVLQDAEDFLNQDLDQEDVDEITAKYKHLDSEILAQRFKLWNQYEGENKLEKELGSMSLKLYAQIIKIYSDFAESQLAENDCPILEGDSKQIESEANYQGNMFLCMVSRIKSPQISSQLQKLLYLDRKSDLFESDDYTKERIFDELYEDIATVSQDTPVTFVGDMPSANLTKGVRENMDVAFCDPITDEEWNIQQKSYVEAHEKGHYIRRLKSEAIGKFFGQTVDLDQVSFSWGYFYKLKATAVRDHGAEAESLTFDDCRRMIVDYLKMPVEIMERMSQLKNYFGFSGNEIFTRQHLAYARENYVKDTGMDNYMEILFRCITPQTEDRFLQVINNCGV